MFLPSIPILVDQFEDTSDSITFSSIIPPFHKQEINLKYRTLLDIFGSIWLRKD